MATLAAPEEFSIPEPYHTTGLLMASSTDREFHPGQFTNLPLMSQLGNVSPTESPQTPKEIADNLTTADVVTSITRVTHPELHPRFSGALKAIIREDFVDFTGLLPDFQPPTLPEPDNFDLIRGIRAFTEAADGLWPTDQTATVAAQALCFSGWLIVGELQAASQQAAARI